MLADQQLAVDQGQGAEERAEQGADQADLLQLQLLLGALRRTAIGKDVEFDGEHVIQEAGIEFIFALYIRGQFGRPGIHPLLPALPHQRSL